MFAYIIRPTDISSSIYYELQKKRKKINQPTTREIYSPSLEIIQKDKVQK
jgi:hypothetical protein